MSAEPLVVAFEVAAPPPQAFAVWTERCAMWWPRAHTVSGDPAAITFDPRPGGLIVERASDGSEHRWGEILAWDPPRRLRYLWHLFFAPEEATEIEVTFTAVEGGTAVSLCQTGWERLGAAGPPRRERTRDVWSTIAAGYRAAC